MKLTGNETDHLGDLLRFEQGFTIRPTDLDPAPYVNYWGRGYGVSLAGYETRIPNFMLTCDVFETLLQTYGEICKNLNESEEIIGDRIYWIGCWIDPENDVVFLDITQIYHDFDEAVLSAKDNGQAAIWDFFNFTAICVG